MDTPIKPAPHDGQLVNKTWDYDKWKASKKAAGTWTGGEAADPSLSKPKSAPFASNSTKAPFSK